MKLISKLCYQARKKGLDVEKSDGVKLMNPINKKYVHILPNGKICSDDILGHDEGLKCLMTEFLVEDSLLFSGSFLALPCDVFLHVGKGALKNEIDFAKDCLKQSFGKIRTLNVVVDNTLLQHDCMINHKYDLSYKERQAFIKACLQYLA